MESKADDVRCWYWLSLSSTAWGGRVTIATGASQGYGWKRPFLRPPSLAEPHQSPRRHEDILGLPDWAHLKQWLQQEGGVEIHDRHPPKSPVQWQDLPSTSSQLLSFLLEKYLLDGALGSVGNMCCTQVEARQCEPASAWSHLSSCLAVCSHLSPMKNIPLSLSKMLSGYE